MKKSTGTAVKPKTTSQITARMYVRIISWTRETSMQVNLDTAPKQCLNSPDTNKIKRLNQTKSTAHRLSESLDTTIKLQLDEIVI